MSAAQRTRTTAALARLGAELIGTATALRRHPVGATVESPVPLDDERPAPIPRGIRVARVILIALGVAGLTFAGYLVVIYIVPRGLPNFVIWLIACVVLHDGVLSPVVLVASQVLRRAGRRIPGVVLAIVQVAVIIGVFVTFVVVPEIVSKSILVRNPTVLPFDYALRLGVAWAAIAVATAIVVAVVVRVRRRTTARGMRALAAART